MTTIWTQEWKSAGSLRLEGDVGAQWENCIQAKGLSCSNQREKGHFGLVQKP